MADTPESAAEQWTQEVRAKGASVSPKQTARVVDFIKSQMAFGGDGGWFFIAENEEQARTFIKFPK